VLGDPRWPLRSRPTCTQTTKQETRTTSAHLWALLDGFRTSGDTHEALKNAGLVGSSWLEDTE